MVDGEEFVAFASARNAELFRCALLLSGEWYAAEDLVQDNWATVYRQWRRVSSAEQPVAMPGGCSSTTSSPDAGGEALPSGRPR